MKRRGVPDTIRILLGGSLLLWGLVRIAFGTLLYQASAIIDFWQVPSIFLMLAGLGLIIGRHIASISMSLLAGGFLFISVLFLLDFSFLPDSTQLQYAIPRELNVNSADISFSFSDLRAQLGGGGVADNILKARFDRSVPKNDSRYSIENDMQKVSLSAQGRRWYGKPFKTGAHLSLSPFIPFSLTFRIERSKIYADLSEIFFRHIAVSSHASRLILILGSSDISERHIKIRSGASDIRIILPEEVAVFVSIKNTLGNFYAPQLIRLDKEHFSSSNFKTAPQKVFFDIISGSSSVDLRYEK